MMLVMLKMMMMMMWIIVPRNAEAMYLNVCRYTLIMIEAQQFFWNDGYDVALTEQAFSCSEYIEMFSCTSTTMCWMPTSANTDDVSHNSVVVPFIPHNVASKLPTIAQGLILVIYIASLCMFVCIAQHHIALNVSHAECGAGIPFVTWLYFVESRPPLFGYLCVYSTSAQTFAFLLCLPFGSLRSVVPFRPLLSQTPNWEAGHHR